MKKNHKTAFFIFILFCFFSSLNTLIFAQNSYEPGKVYHGTKKYIAYYPGTLPIIISAPHGGTLRPDNIKNRTYGVPYNDANSLELVLEMRDALYKYTGKYPHLIVCRLHRRKLDANREINEAAQGDPQAEKAWNEYHDFINKAKSKVEKKYGKGFYFDIHGFDSGDRKIQLGYLMGKEQLSLTDEKLSDEFYAERSSIKTLAEKSSISFAKLIRGEKSLGTLFEENDIPSVPSSRNPKPVYGAFYGGGYNTYIHGSRRGGNIDGVQIETYYYGIRDNEQNRKKFAEIYAKVVHQYLKEHLNIDIKK